jgi:hypothetical protein
MSSNAGDSLVRIPNLPIDKMVDENGNATPSELTFRQTLLSNLQTLFGQEGVVIPIQSPANANTIINNKIINPVTNVAQFSCLLGTMLYVQHPTDYTQDKVVIAVRNDNTYPITAPVFKTFTLT